MKKFTQHPGRVLRELIKQEKNVMMIGAYNGLVGRILKGRGLKATYVSGAALTGSTGQPDIG